MRRGYFLLLVALALPDLAHAQFAGAPWRVRPAVVIEGPADDARVPLVHAAVAHWNQVLAGIGSAFRLGRVTVGGGAGIGTIQVVLSDGEFVSNARRFADGQGALVVIRTTRVPPLSLPNVPRNVIAHELGHAIGLNHNSNPALLMCGRPAPCRPALFASATARYFPLSANWKSQ
jgi:Metallo-peptidase family M12B Reprolysin-like